MNEKFDGCIRQNTFIKAPVEKVYDTIVSADDWNTFFTTGMELDPRPDGDIVFRWNDWGPDFYSLAAPGKVVTADRPNKFAFQWGSPEGGGPSVITFNLEAAHGGTVIRLTEEGYSDTKQGRAMILECASGWGEALTLLKFYIEHGLVYTPPEKNA